MPTEQVQSNSPTSQEALYSEGTKAMDEQRWSDAVTAFDRVVAAKGHLSDAGLYWKAYSLDKLGRKDEARATCESLSKQQPASPWNRECLILQTRSTMDVTKLNFLAQETTRSDIDQLAARLSLEASSMHSQPAQPMYFTDQNGAVIFSPQRQPASEDDIKILALNSLMRQDPSKALPMLKELLNSSKSLPVRRQALFVLSRSKDPQAQALLAETATANGTPQLQRIAVEYLSLSRGKDADPMLAEIYRGSTDAEVKRAAINGLFLTHDATLLVDLARSEKDLNQKRDIVSQLSLMNDKAATDYMLELLK